MQFWDKMMRSSCEMKFLIWKPQVWTGSQGQMVHTLWRTCLIFKDLSNDAQIVEYCLNYWATFFSYNYFDLKQLNIMILCAIFILILNSLMSSKALFNFICIEMSWEEEEDEYKKRRKNIYIKRCCTHITWTPYHKTFVKLFTKIPLSYHVNFQH